MDAEKKDFLKISQLAASAGVSIPTVKHYVREGLLPQPIKTSRNMAYYRREDVDRIRLIKKIQKEKYLPLEVIKRLLDTGESFEEELALGKAILKTDRPACVTTSATRSGIKAATGYPAQKVDILEKADLIHPLEQKGGKVYLPEDVELIRIMADRDALGVPTETSLATLRIYGDAIALAVQQDINFFIRHTVGDTPAEQAIRFMTAADETLDRFIVCFRRKMLQHFSRKTIKGLDRLSENLALLNFLPLPGTLLPEKAPKTPCDRSIYHLLKGNARPGTDTGDIEALPAEAHRLKVLGILAILLGGDAEQALKLVQACIPEPAQSALAAGVAALAYLYSINASAGFSVPMFTMKKVLNHLAHVENNDREPLPDCIFARYICGAIYIFLPDVFATRRRGIDLLESLNREPARMIFKDLDLPAWLAGTLAEEVAPALKVRINRFLALGYMKLGQQDAAAGCLNAVLAAAAPQSEHAAWARMEKARL